MKLQFGKILLLVPCLIALTSAQKPSSKSTKPRQATSQSFGHNSSPGGNHDDGSYPSQPQYTQPQQYHHPQPVHHQPYKAYSPGSLAEKPVYAQILQDNRQLNHDGTINFNYAADNGLQQAETVDADGTRRGFYSYPGADGKMITVKYTAGKNGFQAEGDHLPRQPQVPAHSDQDEDYLTSINTNRGRGAGGGASQYRSQPAPAPVPRAHYAPAPAPAPAPQPIQSYPRPAGPSYSSQSGAYNHHGGNGVQYSTGANPSSGGRFRGFQDFGPSNFGSPQPQYSSNIASHSQSPRSSSGSFSAHNPYQQAGPAGPYTGNFDLGNGGQFTIDFNPGQGQQVSAGGDFSGLQSQRF